MLLFFDTETTGVPKNYKASYTDSENWPRLVQLGFIVYGDNLEEMASGERLVKPEGFTISEQVSKIHGITQTMAELLGFPLDEVLKEFSSWLNNCNILVGHNISYDLNIMAAEYYRKNQSNPLVGKSAYDTMTKSTNLCKIPGNYGNYKWPKLQELYFKLFNEPLAQTHTALDDIRQTAKCYFELKRLGIE